MARPRRNGSVVARRRSSSAGPATSELNPVRLARAARAGPWSEARSQLDDECESRLLHQDWRGRPTIAIEPEGARDSRHCNVVIDTREGAYKGPVPLTGGRASCCPSRVTSHDQMSTVALVVA
jgi:hypothetical protein